MSFGILDHEVSMLSWLSSALVCLLTVLFLPCSKILQLILLVNALPSLSWICLLIWLYLIGLVYCLVSGVLNVLLVFLATILILLLSCLKYNMLLPNIGDILLMLLWGLIVKIIHIIALLLLLELSWSYF